MCDFLSFIKVRSGDVWANTGVIGWGGVERGDNAGREGVFGLPDVEGIVLLGASSL